MRVFKILYFQELKNGTFETNSQLVFTATRFENGVSFRCEADNVVMRDEMEKPLHDSLVLEVMCKCSRFVCTDTIFSLPKPNQTKPAFIIHSSTVGDGQTGQYYCQRDRRIFNVLWLRSKSGFAETSNLVSWQIYNNV